MDSVCAGSAIPTKYLGGGGGGGASGSLATCNRREGRFSRSPPRVTSPYRSSAKRNARSTSSSLLRVIKWAVALAGSLSMSAGETIDPSSATSGNDAERTYVLRRKARKKAWTSAFNPLRVLVPSEPTSTKARPLFSRPFIFNSSRNSWQTDTRRANRDGMG